MTDNLSKISKDVKYYLLNSTIYSNTCSISCLPHQFQLFIWNSYDSHFKAKIPFFQISTQASNPTILTKHNLIFTTHIYLFHIQQQSLFPYHTQILGLLETPSNHIIVT